MGVSLHQIDNGIDTGDIWVQKPIKINFTWDNKKYIKSQKRNYLIYLRIILKNNIW